MDKVRELIAKWKSEGNRLGSGYLEKNEQAMGLAKALVSCADELEAALAASEPGQPAGKCPTCGHQKVGYFDMDKVPFPDAEPAGDAGAVCPTCNQNPCSTYCSAGTYPAAPAAQPLTYEEWRKSLPICVGYNGGCDGDLAGEEHEVHCPMYGHERPTLKDAFEAGAAQGSVPENFDARAWCDGQRKHPEIGHDVQQLQSWAPDALARVIDFCWRVWLPRSTGQELMGWVSEESSEGERGTK